jgi:hypothetical protein
VNKVSHPYRTTGKIIVLYIQILTFLDSRRENKRHWTEWQQFSLLIFSWIRFWFVTVIPKYLNCATFPKNLLAIFMSWVCPASRLTRQQRICLVFSAFTSRLTSVLASIKVPLFFFMVSILMDLRKASLGVLAPALHNGTVEACCATVCSDHVIHQMM